MTHEKRSESNLSGVRTLIVEDDFYLAMDSKEQIERAGGTVLGPCFDTSAAMAELVANPSCAIVDISHGRGPSFEIADALQDRSVPFLFLTGYEKSMIPARFAGIDCFQKPADTFHVIKAIARLTQKMR